MTDWKTYPLNVPDPGMYVVAFNYLGIIRYDVAEWKFGEWVGLFEDDVVVAFLPVPEYLPGQKQAQTPRKTTGTRGGTS